MIADRPVTRIVFKDGADRSGLIVRTDGRVCLVSSGQGLSLQLDAAQMRELGRQATGVAALLADREQAAAAEASADLRRVMAGSVASDDD